MIFWISAVLIVSGLFFFFATTVGILRFPDFYSRMHAAGKGDTLSSLLMLCGFALYQFEHVSTGAFLTALKIILISVFIFLASPTATHAIIDAGYESGIKPWSKNDNPDRTGDGENDLAV